MAWLFFVAQTLGLIGMPLYPKEALDIYGYTMVFTAICYFVQYGFLSAKERREVLQGLTAQEIEKSNEQISEQDQAFLQESAGLVLFLNSFIGFLIWPITYYLCVKREVT